MRTLQYKMAVEDCFKDFNIIRLSKFFHVMVDAHISRGISALGINDKEFILIWPDYNGKHIRKNFAYRPYSLKPGKRKVKYELTYVVNDFAPTWTYQKITASNSVDFLQEMEKFFGVKITEDKAIIFDDEDFVV